MPIAGQHALRIADPKTMDPESYRTTAGGTLYGGSVKVPSTINIIWAKPKTRNKPSDPPMVQSLRFPTKNGWTKEKAQDWLAKNKMVGKGKFEPAEEEKKSNLENDDSDNFSEKGNVSTFLQATIHGALSRNADGLLANGVITSSQRKSISSAVGAALDEFRETLESRFPEVTEVKYPRNKEDRTYFHEDQMLAIFDYPVEAASDNMMDYPLKANEALEMDDIELGVYVKKLIEKAMARKRITINVFEDE